MGARDGAIAGASGRGTICGVIAAGGGIREIAAGGGSVWGCQQPAIPPARNARTTHGRGSFTGALLDGCARREAGSTHPVFRVLPGGERVKCKRGSKTCQRSLAARVTSTLGRGDAG